jgi:hypothetical protein
LIRNSKEESISQEHSKSANAKLNEYFNQRNLIKFHLTASNWVQENQLGSKSSRVNLATQQTNGKNGLAKQTKCVIYNFNISENNVFLDENDEIVKPKSNKVQTNVKLAAQFQLKSQFTCPFCMRDCLNPICLNKHLINTHFRFQVYLEKAKENGTHQSNGSKNGLTNGSNSAKTVFELFNEDNYDGSYIGNQYDLHYAAHLGYSNCRVKPTKRASITYVLFNR